MTNMQLVIDIGNSNVVFGVFQADQLVCCFRITTQINRTADEYAHTLFGLLALNKINAQDLEYVALSSVVPPLDLAFRDLAERYLQRKAYFVGRELVVPLKIAVENP